MFPSNTVIVQPVLHLPRWQMMLWYAPLLFGLTASVWFVRFTSSEFPVLDRLQWFASPQQIEPHSVLVATQRLEKFMAERVPSRIDAGDAVHDPWFYRRDRRLCAERPAKYAFWQQRLEGRTFADLSDGETRIVLSERQLYDHYHRDTWLTATASDGLGDGLDPQ